MAKNVSLAEFYGVVTIQELQDFLFDFTSINGSCSTFEEVLRFIL